MASPIVPFDIVAEQPITLKEAVKGIPSPRSDTGSIAVHTIRRWITAGLMGPRGHQVQLQGVRMGRTLVTSRESLQRFCHTLSGGAPDHSRESAVEPASAN